MVFIYCQYYCTYIALSVVAVLPFDGWVIYTEPAQQSQFLSLTWLHFTVLRILPSRSHCVLVDLVQRLGSFRHHPSREPHRAHHLHCRCVPRYTYLPHWLVWYHSQQSRLPRVVQLPSLDYVCPPCYPRIHHLQETHLQPRRQDQCPVVKSVGPRWPTSRPEPAQLLRLFQPLR